MIHPFFLYFQESLAVKTLLVTLDHLLGDVTRTTMMSVSNISIVITLASF